MFRFSSLSPSLVCRHVLFGLSPDEVRSIPRIFVYIFLDSPASLASWCSPV